MTKDDICSAVDKMVDRIRVVWLLLLLVGVGLIIFYDVTLWMVPVCWVLAVIGYNIHLLSASRNLAKKIVESGDIVEDDVAQTAESVEVVDTCTSMVGRYYDFDIPEWIDVRIGDKLQRYVFKDFAPRVGDAFALPTSGDHILYKAGIFQPA